MIYVALVGLTLIITRGTIFEKMRSFYPNFLGCCQCVGTWVGGAAGASGIVPAGHGPVLDAIIVGCATSVLSFVTTMVILKLDE